jgi:hypothetical protein
MYQAEASLIKASRLTRGEAVPVTSVEVMRHYGFGGVRERICLRAPGCIFALRTRTRCH